MERPNEPDPELERARRAIEEAENYYKDLQEARFREYMYRLIGPKIGPDIPNISPEGDVISPNE